jgi:hypothetical protein
MLIANYARKGAVDLVVDEIYKHLAPNGSIFSRSMLSQRLRVMYHRSEITALVNSK